MSCYDAIMIGVGTVRIKILPQHMNALWADERVRFSGLPRAEAGIYVCPLGYPAELRQRRIAKGIQP